MAGRLASRGDWSSTRTHCPLSAVLRLCRSAHVAIARAQGTMVFEDPVNGYEAMWSHIGDVARGEACPLMALETLLDDLGFAMDLVDSCDKLLSQE
jgi:hypothetical protein